MCHFLSYRHGLPHCKCSLQCCDNCWMILIPSQETKIAMSSCVEQYIFVFRYWYLAAWWMTDDNFGTKQNVHFFQPQIQVQLIKKYTKNIVLTETSIA